MANEQLKIIIDAVNQTRGEIGKLKDDLGGVDEAAEQASRGVGDFKDGLADAIEETTGLSLESITLAGAVTGAVVAVVDATKKAAEYGDEMGDLAQITGQSVEQTSLMVSSFELVGVGADAITQAMKALTSNGLTPNMETMKRLSQQYQAIQDPVKQNEFLFKNFGKAGLEMAEIMGKNTEELKRLEDAARSSGKVIGEELAGQAEELNLQLAILQQKGEGAQIMLGSVFVPAASQAVDGVTNLAKTISAASIAFQLNTGQIDRNQAILRANALAAGDLMAHMKEFEPVYEETTEAQKFAAMETRGLVKAFGEIPAPADLAYQANARYLSSLDGIIGAATDLKFSMSEVTKEMIFQAASAGMPAEAALELARAMGLVDEQALSTKQTLDELRVKYDSDKDGAISAAEAARGYTRDVAALGSAVERLPKDTTVNITTVLTEVRRQAQEALHEKTGTGRQHGGPVYAGETYALHPPELYFAPRETGFIMSQAETRELLELARSGGGGQTVTIAVDARGAVDPAAVEAAGYRGAQRALAEAGYRADAMRRAG